MTPEAMAQIHVAAFTRLRPWSAAGFAGLLAGAGVFVLTDAGIGTSPPPRGEGMGVGGSLATAVQAPPPHPSPTQGGGSRLPEPVGFLLGRALAGEAEVLTLAVRPGMQGRGIGLRLLVDFLTEAEARGAKRAFLEVAADNGVARRLYLRAGFADVGLRRGYFALTAGGTVDGIVMARDLPGF